MSQISSHQNTGKKPGMRRRLPPSLLVRDLPARVIRSGFEPSVGCQRLNLGVRRGLGWAWRALAES